jgi:hypothetical protein
MKMKDHILAALQEQQVSPGPLIPVTPKKVTLEA